MYAAVRASILWAAATTLATAAPALGQAQDEAPSSSLMARALQQGPPPAPGGYSLFQVEAPQQRRFHKHDLIQIIVRETSTARSKHELETEKDFRVNGKIQAWPDLQLSQLLQLQLQASANAAAPAVDLRLGKDFDGSGDYERRDDLTARLSAEVIEVLPNGNLILEARSSVRNDEEESVIKVTGICRPEDISPANTVLSSQIHDLRIAKANTGELRQATKKGLLARVFDFIWAW
jgi:flagellar L-ring protein precursor FlgH